jgi:diguanylate cyclase (GGDEF)-like protein
MATMLIVLVSGHLFTGVLVIAYTARHERSKAVNTFLLSKLLQPLSWILLGLRGMIPSLALVAFANSLLFTGAALELIAFMLLKGCYTPKVRKSYLALLTGCIVVFCSAVAFGFSENVRITFASSITAVLMAFPVYRLLADRKASILQRMIAIFYGVTILFLLFRANAAITTDLDMNLASTSIFNTWLFVLLYLDMIAGSTGFILLDKEKLDAELMKAASVDGLTNTLNRKTFVTRAEELISLFARKREPISCLLIDIDDFKKINDVHGHFMGDVVLQSFAETIRSHLRNYDLFGRYGGEEFAILLPGADGKETLEIAERLRAAVEASSVDGNPGIKYTVSIGASTVMPDGETRADTLYKLSDRALYAAKDLGKNRVAVA